MSLLDPIIDFIAFGGKKNDADSARAKALELSLIHI